MRTVTREVNFVSFYAYCVANKLTLFATFILRNDAIKAKKGQLSCLHSQMWGRERVQ